MSQENKEYTRDELTVSWEPEKCIHSAVCAKGLPRVFNPKRRPWVDLNAAEKDQIINQVNACPSKALSIKNQ